MAMDHSQTALDVLDFWWKAGESKWFARSDAFDEAIRSRFSNEMAKAAGGAFQAWEETPHGCLALLLLLDQFPRNVFRNSPKAFANDEKALELAGKAVDRGFDRAFPTAVRVFFYLPFEHAEVMAAQERAVDLCHALGEMRAYHYALIHMDVIRRFGRFPHRNKVLGRQSTKAEEAFLADGGFSA